MLIHYPLNVKLLQKIPIPMYANDLKHIKKYIIKSKKGLRDYLKIAKNKTHSAVVINAEWYILNSKYCNNVVGNRLGTWTSCEIYRELYGVGIIVVIALKPNHRPSSRINKRIVDRSFHHDQDPVCSYTRESILRQDASAEHIIPLSNGGNNSVWNICVANNKLNNNRGNQDYWKYWHYVLLEEIS